MSGKFCPKCGTLINGNIRFCAKCGTSLQDNSVPHKNDDVQRFINSDFVQMLRQDYFSYSGRLNRKPYFYRSLILGIIQVICYIILDTPMEIDTALAIVLFCVFGMIFVLCIVADTMLDIRRFHDLNLSGWLVLLTVIPAFTPFVYLYLLIAPGTKGVNKYGEDLLS